MSKELKDQISDYVDATADSTEDFLKKYSMGYLAAGNSPYDLMEMILEDEKSGKSWLRTREDITDELYQSFFEEERPFQMACDEIKCMLEEGKMTHYITHYEGLSGDQKFSKAIQDIRDYVGRKKFSELTDKFGDYTKENGPLEFEQFQLMISFVGVQGFPAKAWYKYIWGNYPE
ncbi:hypothetical protein GP486_008326 [Trichoglossum hirsutum]|uniref:Uncharacterized protein n=1 Tax=Trichoglossum hirsutum TaxID=265104 RepID=A0A9P8IA78_9PEZI|nr:hypothetical protein GP486_008326 [Trichoglossum hirsutum]